VFALETRCVREPLTVSTQQGGEIDDAIPHVSPVPDDGEIRLDPLIGIPARWRRISLVVSVQALRRPRGSPVPNETESASALHTQALILRELRELGRRLARIEEAIPVLAALSASSEADAALREQRRTRQVRGRRYLADKLGEPAARARAAARRRSDAGSAAPVPAGSPGPADVS
jgi:hypothetical protein